MTNLKWITALTVLLLGPAAMSQTSAKDGLDRLKTNFENSKSNLNDYQKNLKIVDENVAEVLKAKATIVQQEKEVTKAADENQKSLKAAEMREAEVNQAIAEEQKQIAIEEQKNAELEKLSMQLRDNQKKRQANIASYQEQLKAIASERKDWKTRTEQVAKTQSQVKAKVNSLTTQETEWKNKKLGYQGEVTRWGKEVEREKKLVETYSSLADVKD